jgi:ABC-2 type transport system permease protein
MNGLSGVLFGQFAVVAIATLAATGEYATGTMRSTLSTVPKRSAVLAAKASVVGVLCLAAGLVASLAAFLVSQPVLHGNGFVPEQGYPIVSLADEPALRAVVGSGLYLALVGLLSLASECLSGIPRPRSRLCSGCSWCRSSPRCCCPSIHASWCRGTRR